VRIGSSNQSRSNAGDSRRTNRRRLDESSGSGSFATEIGPGPGSRRQSRPESSLITREQCGQMTSRSCSCPFEVSWRHGACFRKVEPNSRLMVALESGGLLRTRDRGEFVLFPGPGFYDVAGSISPDRAVLNYPVLTPRLANACLEISRDNKRNAAIKPQTDASHDLSSLFT
jgi:hypothetical protein